MKIFQSGLFSTNIQKELKDTIKEYNANVRYANYGGVAGLNRYSDVDWIILFGSYNIPQDVRRIRSKQTGISEDKLEWIYGPGTLKQMSHRGRTIQRPNVVSLYSLTNMIKGVFPQEEEFFGITEVKYRDLINWIARRGGVKTKDIEIHLNKPNKSVLNILNKLYKEGLLKSVKKSFGRGPPSWVWYVK